VAFSLPLTQVIGLTAAHADDPSGYVPPPSPSEPPPDTCAPSNAIAVFSRAGAYYAVKVEEGGEIDGLSPRERSALEDEFDVTLVTSTAHLQDFSGGVDEDSSFILWSITDYDYYAGTVKDGNGNGLAAEDFDIIVAEDRGVWFYKLVNCGD